MDNASTAAERIRGVGEALQRRSESIYETGELGPDIWEELMDEDLLGKLAATGAATRAIVAQIRNMEDTVLGETIVEAIMNIDIKNKAFKRNPVKAWVQALKGELDTKLPGSVIRTAEPTEEGGRTTNVIGARPKVEFKLEVYEGVEDGCSIWFHGIERQMRKLKIEEEDFLVHAINRTEGKAKAAITMLDERHVGDYSQSSKRR